MVADIEFSIVSSASVDITFSDSDQSGAYSTSLLSGSYLSSSTVNIPTWWNETPYVDVEGNLDEYAFQTYIHELGHALGLGHQGQYNGGAVYGVDNEFTNDSWMYSVMSYFSQDDNTDVDGSYAYVMSAMMADVVAMQDLYGAAGVGSATWGNTTWGNGSDLGNYMDDIFEGSSNGDVGNNTVTYTIYDAGGTDIVRLNNYSSNIDFDMNDESSSSIGNKTNIIHIARDTVIEDLQTGSGNDTVTGNSVGNWIRTGNGKDTVFGGNGADIVSSGGGADKVLGEKGKDTISGQAGSDILKGGNGNDDISGGSGGDDISGGSGDDDIEGGSGGDDISGGSGDDVIKGGSGSDDLSGGDGKDAIYGEDGSDVVDAGNGADKVYGGDGADTLKLGKGNDSVLDGNGADEIYGGSGKDTFTFGSGDDTAWGGADADTFIFGRDDGTDRIKDFDLTEDSISLNSSLWSGNLTAAEVVDEFAVVSGGGNTIFTFDDGETLYVSGVTDLDALTDTLTII
jgi:serralysin